MKDRGNHMRREKRTNGGKWRKRDLEQIKERIIERLKKDGEEEDDNEEDVEIEDDEYQINNKEFFTMNSFDGGSKKDDITSKKEEIGRKDTGGKKETWRVDSDESYLESKTTNQIEEGRIRQRVSFSGILPGIGTKSFENGMTMGTDKKLRTINTINTKINFSMKEELFIS